MTDEILSKDSEQGENIIVPEDVSDKFNWGAFLLTWIWGLGNNTYITLLMLATVVLFFIPIINLIALPLQLGLGIWFGIKGNEWAWKNKKFASVEAFHSYQKKWAIAGAILAALGIILTIALVIFVLLIIAAGVAAD